MQGEEVAAAIIGIFAVITVIGMLVTSYIDRKGRK